MSSQGIYDDHGCGKYLNCARRQKYQQTQHALNSAQALNMYTDIQPLHADADVQASGASTPTPFSLLTPSSCSVAYLINGRFLTCETSMKAACLKRRKEGLPQVTSSFAYHSDSPVVVCWE